MASMFLAVSMKLSPLERLEPPGVKSRVSALSRRAARLKLVRVRVDGSKNRFTTTLPLRNVRFLRRFWLSSTKFSAVSRMVTSSSRLSSSRPRRWRLFHWAGAVFSRAASSAGMGSPSETEFVACILQRGLGLDRGTVVIGVRDQDLVLRKAETRPQLFGHGGGAIRLGHREQRRPPRALSNPRDALPAEILDHRFAL